MKPIPEVTISLTVQPEKSVERKLIEAERVIEFLIVGEFVTKEKVTQARALAESLKP